MTIAAARTLTYEDYLAEGEINRRYDILDGARLFMPNPTERHQDIVGNLYLLLRDVQRRSGIGKAIFAPCDVLIRQAPLRTRQPDVLFISNARLALNRPPDDPAPMSPAPELVVEIRSPSGTTKVLSEKLADYASVEVQECWLVDMESQSIEARTQSAGVWQSVATYRRGETIPSVAFPALQVALDDLFIL